MPQQSTARSHAPGCGVPQGLQAAAAVRCGPPAPAPHLESLRKPYLCERRVTRAWRSSVRQKLAAAALRRAGASGAHAPRSSLPTSPEAPAPKLCAWGARQATPPPAASAPPKAHSGRGCAARCCCSPAAAAPACCSPVAHQRGAEQEVRVERCGAVEQLHQAAVSAQAAQGGKRSGRALRRRPRRRSWLHQRQWLPTQACTPPWRVVRSQTPGGAFVELAT